MTRILITLCTYNERENVDQLIPELLTTVPEASILVIDDNSPDGTGLFVQQLSRREERVAVLHRPSRQGLGAATVAGFQYAIQQGYDVLVNMDADFSHQPVHIPEMLQRLQDADVVIGSRYVPGGGVVGWGLRRKLMSRLINILARVMLGLSTRDNSGSFRCYRVSCLRRIDWKKTVARGYAFQEEVLYRCVRSGCRLIEFPIVFHDRRYGQTKINLYESITAVRDIIRLGMQRLLRRSVLTEQAAQEASQDQMS